MRGERIKVLLKNVAGYVSSAVDVHRRQNAGPIQTEYGTNRLGWASTEFLWVVIRSFSVAKISRLVVY